jgi:hypothetical protein
MSVPVLGAFENAFTNARIGMALHDSKADRGPTTEAAQSPRHGSRVVISRLPAEQACPRCRRVTGVEEDDSTGSSLHWFVCRLCGHRWSVAPKKAR